MNWKKKLLYSSQLYVIVDKQVLYGKQIAREALKIAKAGIRLIQFRDKVSDIRAFLNEAALLKRVLFGTGTVCIINDRVDVAKAIDADGVHLGACDMPIEYARKVLGNSKIIGISCKNVTEALDAQERGADYVGVGPVFFTTTKPQTRTIRKRVLRNCNSRLRIPVFAIGGINESNVTELLRFGVRKVAVSKPICRAADLHSVIHIFKSSLR